MSLAEGKALIDISEADFVDAGAAVEKWRDFPASALSHHGRACCRVAREWVLGMDYSQLNAGNPLTGPRWLRHKYTWGPSAWPIHWCEAVRRKTLDCGALAALAHEVFSARGVRSFPAQLIQQFSEDATRQWYERWGGDRSSVHWIKEDLIYHEGCAVVVRGDEVKLWDASAGWWIDPNQAGGYGALLAVRITNAQTATPTSFTWGTRRIAANTWQKIERSRAAAASSGGGR